MEVKKYRIFYILAVIFIATALLRCNSHEFDGDKVYYVYWNEGSGTNKILIKDADAKTFKRLKHKKYAVDKNNVYYEAQRLKDADPKTFISLLDYYGKDRQFVYREGSKIIGADSKTFVIINVGPYSKDYKDYYFDTIALHVNNVSSFKILNQVDEYRYWAKDKSHYYILSKKYPLADYESFINLENGYAKDKFKVYFRDSVVDGADVKSFKVLEDYGYAQDKNSKYDGIKKLDIKDPNSYKVIRNGLTKDKFHVYSDNKIIPGADPLTFEIVSWEWTKDKSSYFYQGKPMPIVDYKTFVLLANNYAKDKNSVYYNDQILDGADSKTFIVNEMTYIAKDKFGCYQDGEKVDCDKIKDE